MRVNRIQKAVYKSKSTSDIKYKDNVVMRFLQEYRCDASALQSLTLELPGSKTETFNCPVRQPSPLPPDRKSTRLNSMLCCQRGDEIKQIAEWCLATTFRLFSLKDIMLIYSALRLECSIVVVCRSLGLLSAVM